MNQPQTTNQREFLPAKQLNGQLDKQPANIFISFSPADREFVRKLEAEFNKAGRSTWTGSDQTTSSEEIKGLIEAAENFIFVAPAAESFSDTQQSELRLAADYHKHIIPIVRADVGTDTVPREILGLSSIPFRDAGDFASSFQSLLNRIDADLRLDVFISYSRKDEVFVQSLEESLRTAGKRVWIDRKSIQHSEEWLRAIYSGIEAADNFVFVLSPDSVISDNCAKELAHAVEHNKRLVPILRRDPDAQPVPTTLAELDWVPFRETDDFGSKLQTLLTTIDTDLDHVRTHTRLLTRAIEWDKRDRDKSLVLRGKDLREAEQWLVHSGTKKPKATNVQSQYITSSRQSATSTQRTILVAISAGLVISIGLLIWAVIQYRIAEAERKEAKERLAALYEEEGRRELLDGSPIRALAYLNEANQEGSTASSLQFLLAQAQLALVGQTASYNGHAQEVRAIAVSRDNQRAVTAGDGGIARVWETTTGKLLFMLEGHNAGIRAVTFSPDYQKILTASMDYTAKIWNGNNGALLSSLEGHQGFIESAHFSHNGKHIVTAGADGLAVVWDSESGRKLYSLAGHTGPLFKAVFSPDDKLIVTGSADKTAKVWDSKDGRLLASLTDHSNWVVGIAFSPDSTKIVTASYDNSAKIWDARNGKRLAILRKGEGEYEHNGHDGPIVSITFSRDGRKILTASWDRTANIWDGHSGEFIAALSGHTDKLTMAAFNESGTYVVTASDDSTVKVWDGSTGALLSSLDGHTERVNAAVFMPNDRFVVTTGLDARAIVWDWRLSSSTRPISLDAHTDTVSSAEFSADGKEVVTASADGTARIWNVESGKLKVTLDDGKKILLKSASFSPNGSRVVTFGDHSELRIWDALSGQHLLSLDGGQAKINAAMFDFDGKRIVTARSDGVARVWDVATGKLLISPSGHNGAIKTAAFSRDGKRILTGGDDGLAKMWDSTTGTLLATFQGHTGPILSAVFNPDGTRALTASADKTARLWNTATGSQVVSLAGHGGPVVMAAFSPDGSQVVTASQDKSAKIWNAATGELVASLDAHLDVVKSARFDMAGGRVVTAGDDNSVKVWDATTGRLLISLEGHTESVKSAIFSPDNTRIVTASDDHTAKIWDVHLEIRSKDVINEIVRRHVPFRVLAGRLLPAMPG